MSWIQKREEEVVRGKKLNWIERRSLEHADPILLLLLVIGSLVACYALWQHDWVLFWGGFAIATIGHIISWLRM